MKLKLPLLLIGLFLLAGKITHAQDLMYLRNSKTPVLVKVHEVGLDEVKYKPWGDTTMPILVMPRMNVERLILANGSVFEFSQNPMADASNYADQHNNAIKFNFLSPLFTNMYFSYERSLKPGRSLEVGVSIIGLGIGYENNNLGGMYGRVGYKFISTPDFYMRGMRYSHILKGGYIKPEFIFGGYGVDNYYSMYSSYSSSRSTTYRDEVIFGGALVNFGKQWVFDDSFLFDMYLGIGYGFTNYRTQYPLGSGYYSDSYTPYNYAFLGGIKEFPLAITAGFKIGFVFGKQPPADLKKK